jgi:alkanesulfonate monooxygenase SsuD/methylene tetrahydromethanopterin reductase-like flavin-dependent oxidoreductase (luciferase family)
LLAKMAATLHELTGGRFILGLGAGWQEEDYTGYGYDYPSGGVRVAQLAEAIEVIRAMWTQSPATYHGTHYRVDNGYCEPRPGGAIPIMVGTNGPKALRVTARLADMWNWDGPWDQLYREPFETLRRNCDEIGRPFNEIALTAGFEVSLPDDPKAYAGEVDSGYYDYKSYPLGPTPQDAIREIERLVDVGVRHFQLYFDGLPTLRRFIDEVEPAVRLKAEA